MKSSLWLIIAIPAVLAVSGLLLIKNPQNPASKSGASAQVLMKADSFEPETLTIKKGTTVEFKNVDKDLHWPASDIHPTHTIYPQFDPQKPIEPGQSWQFSFERVGNWRDHDHLVPSTRGTIVVTEN